MADLFDKTVLALAASNKMRSIRENVITGNIANAETPGYVAKKVDFEEALQRAVDEEGFSKLPGVVPEHIAIGPGALARVEADVYDNPDGETSNDGNTVNLEREMSSLAENSIMYKAAIQLINKKMAALKYAASDGGK